MVRATDSLANHRITRKDNKIINRTTTYEPTKYSCLCRLFRGPNDDIMTEERVMHMFWLVHQNREEEKANEDVVDDEDDYSEGKRR